MVIECTHAWWRRETRYMLTSTHTGIGTHTHTQPGTAPTRMGLRLEQRRPQFSHMAPFNYRLDAAWFVHQHWNPESSSAFLSLPHTHVAPCFAQIKLSWHPKPLQFFPHTNNIPRSWMYNVHLHVTFHCDKEIVIYRWLALNRLSQRIDIDISVLILFLVAIAFGSMFPSKESSVKTEITNKC